MERIQLPRPTLIIGAGNSATGKTTHLLALTKLLYDAFWIDKDTIEDTMLRRMDHAGKEIERYFSNRGVLPRKREHHLEHVELQAYLLMLEEAKNNLCLGKHPIIDGNYVRELQQGYFALLQDFFKETPCAIKILYFHAPENVVKERMKERGAARDDDKLRSEEAWKEFLRREPIIIHNLEELPHLKVDSTKPVDENIRAIIKYLQE